MHRTDPDAPAAEDLVHEVPPDLVQLLVLPPHDALTADRARGAVCVWGTERLTGETAVDLGEQSDPRWFPRACRRHVADRAHLALFVHGRDCDDCRADDCDVNRALYGLVRDCRR
jgi:hypothetical protein